MCRGVIVQTVSKLVGFKPHHIIVGGGVALPGQLQGRSQVHVLRGSHSFHDFGLPAEENLLVSLQLLIVEVTPPQRLELVSPGALDHNHKESDWLRDNGEGKRVHGLHVDYHPRYRTDVERNKSDEQVDQRAAGQVEPSQEGEDQSGKEHGGDGKPGALSVELRGDGRQGEHERVLEQVDDVVVVGESDDVVHEEPHHDFHAQKSTDQADAGQQGGDLDQFHQRDDRTHPEDVVDQPLTVEQPVQADHQHAGQG